MPTRSLPLSRFVAAAQPARQLWKTALGFGLVAVSALAMTPAASHAPGPQAALSALAAFLGPLCALWLAVTRLHGRPVRSLIGPGGLSPWRTVPLAMLAMILAQALALALSLPVLRVEPGLPLGPWAMWLVPALAAIAVQATTEELVFRGYLLQQLAARFRHPIAWAVVPSALFALAHWGAAAEGVPPAAAAAIAFLFGIVAADVTARTGSLAPAIGLHVAHNALALTVLAQPGPLLGLSLWVAVPPADPRAALWQGLAAVLALVAAHRICRVLIPMG